MENQSGLSYKYEYDKLGNITKIYERASGAQQFTLKVSYTYDGLNQLKTETKNGTTITYNYDKAGNILSKVTTGGTSSTVSYGYGDSNWKDKLTAYNGQSITYDAIGNPLTYRDGMSFTWANGRSLATYKKGNTTAAYTYNTDGIRTKKVVNGVTTDFHLNGSDIVTQISGLDRLDFAYDEAGNLYGFFYQNTPYLYVRNGQGDITGILDDSGDVAVSYEYDSWGNVTKITDNSSAKVGILNPFRYRGYYFDQESGLYYLQSRYYDATTCRFINADGYASTGQGVLGNNMFAYCGNNPVNRADPSGQLWITAGLEMKLGKSTPGSMPIRGAAANEKFAGAKDVDRSKTSIGYYNCYGNAMGKEIYTDPTGYTKGDSTEKTFEAVVNDIGATNIRRINSQNDEVKYFENLVALKCGPEDYHFMVRVDGLWYSKPGNTRMIVEPLNIVTADIWYMRRWDYLHVYTNNKHYYNDETIYFAIMKEWD